MPVLQNSFFVFRAGWLAAAIARKLKRARTAVPAQFRTFSSLVEKLALSDYGRDFGIGRNMTYAEFKARIPLRNYEQLEPYIRRIKRGAASVLWPGDCRWFTLSAGTTGAPKWLPVTDDMLTGFRNAEAESIFYYSVRSENSRVFRGPHLSLAQSLKVRRNQCGETVSESDRPTVELTALKSEAAAIAQLAEPPENIACMDDWSAKTDAIIARTLSLDISLLAGLPNWLLVFAETLRNRATTENRPSSNLLSLWPNLECIVHHGIPVAPFQEELKRAAGPAVTLHEIFFAAEAFVAAQDTEGGSGLRLLDDAGVFYEFLPLADYNEALPLSLGTKALALNEIRAGEDYVLLVTTPAGLCRYILGDIVRFTSLEPARLVPVGHIQLRLNAFDENVIESDVTESLVTVCKQHDWTITNFHVAPLFSSSLIGQTHGRHEWWVELKPGTMETPTGPILAAHLDVVLQARSQSYATKRQRGPIEPPVVRLVMPGFFSHWMQHHNKWGELQKMPRCRSDRLIADEFSALACFNAD